MKRGCGCQSCAALLPPCGRGGHRQPPVEVHKVLHLAASGTEMTCHEVNLPISHGCFDLSWSGPAVTSHSFWSLFVLPVNCNIVYKCSNAYFPLLSYSNQVSLFCFSNYISVFRFVTIIWANNAIIYSCRRTPLTFDTFWHSGYFKFPCHHVWIAPDSCSGDFEEKNEPIVLP